MWMWMESKLWKVWRSQRVPRGNQKL